MQGLAYASAMPEQVPYVISSWRFLTLLTYHLTYLAHLCGAECLTLNASWKVAGSLHFSRPAGSSICQGLQHVKPTKHYFHDTQEMTANWRQTVWQHLWQLMGPQSWDFNNKLSGQHFFFQSFTHSSSLSEERWYCCSCSANVVARNLRLLERSQHLQY